MLKETSWMKILLTAALAAGLCACSSGNSDVSPFDNPHSGIATGLFSAAAAHGPVAKANLQSCQPCHATPSNGINPRFNVPRLNIASGCETCHKALTAHPTPWLPERVGTPFNIANATSHATAGSLGTACVLCHGSSLDGVGGNAPSCMSGSLDGIGCHVTSPAAQPAGCTSCHGGPPGGPDGVAALPNRAFAHGKHTQHNLACAVCHLGAGFGKATHADGTADVQLTATFQANIISFAFDRAGGTCAGVSCHGGQTTPNWQTADAIVVATDCLKCHELGTAAGVPQNNSPSSGKHQSHLAGAANAIFRLNNAVDIACTDCHSPAKLTAQVHFGGLDTPGFDTPPRDTVGGTLRLPDPGYDAQNTCLPTCHVSGRRGWFE